MRRMNTMKKLITMIAVSALCAAMMTGCAYWSASEPQPAPGIYTEEKVPELVLAPVGDAVPFESMSIQPSNYGWNWPKGNGEYGGVEACGFGPTDPAILTYLAPIDISEPVTVKLIWPSFPAQSVNIVSWDINVLELPSDADQSQQDGYLREVTLTEGEEFERTLLLEPDRVYDIYVNWQEVNGSSFGNAHYYVVTKAAGNEKESESNISGGWQVSESPEITSELRAVFDKALDGFVGVGYEPIAYLGSQIVAGTNHAFFCKAQVVYPNAQPYFAIVFIYEDLEGNAGIKDIASMTAYGELDENAGSAEQLAGGWSVAEAQEDGMAAFEKASEYLTGASYAPIRVLSSQVVAGMNYCILCQAQVVVPGAEPYYTLAFVYEDLEGNAEFTQFKNLDITMITVLAAATK